MKRTKLVMILISVFLLSSLNTFAKEKKEKKEATDGFALVDSGQYEFVAQSMTSQKGAYRALTTIYTVVINDSTSTGYLPYIGRAHSGAYGGDGAIEFDNKMLNYKIELKERKKEKNNQKLVSYEIKGKNDTYTLRFTISKTGNTSLSVSSNNRQPVSFQGTLQEIEVKEEKKKKKDKKKDKE